MNHDAAKAAAQVTLFVGRQRPKNERKQMDEYYAKLIRSKLSEAQQAITEAQNYAIEADAPGWLNSSLKRNLSSLRNRQDEIASLMRMQRAAQQRVNTDPAA